MQFYFTQDKKVNLEGFLSETDMDTYVSALSKDGTYADNLSIAALCETLSCKVKIISATSKINMGNASASLELTLGYIPEIQHYVSLEALPK